MTLGVFQLPFFVLYHLNSGLDSQPVSIPHQLVDAELCNLPVHQVAHVRLVIVKNHGAGAHPQYFQPRTTVWGQLWGQLNTNHMNIYIVINSLQLLFGSRRAYQLKGREERSGIFADIQRATDFEVDSGTPNSPRSDRNETVS
jgi:hypothetical protein